MLHADAVVTKSDVLGHDHEVSRDRVSRKVVLGKHVVMTQARLNVRAWDSLDPHCTICLTVTTHVQQPSKELASTFASRRLQNSSMQMILVLPSVLDVD